jgi:LysM repeat protein
MFGRKLLHILLLAGAVLVVWSIAARPSGAHGPKSYYRVKPYDTLWSIAQAHYGGDVRGDVWQIQQANHLTGSVIAPGERLLLP